MVTVIYGGPASTYINFPTQEQPDGFSFNRGEAVDVPADLWPVINATGLFECVGPVPVPEPAPSPAVLVEEPLAEPLADTDRSGDA